MPMEHADRDATTTWCSIIIPLYNRLDMTQACVASLLAHHVPGVEIILVDNASTDGTAEWCATLSEPIRVERSDHNINFAGACNLGAELARGALLVFLNNDTVVTDGWLEALTQPLSDERIGVVGARLLYPDGSIQHAGVAYGPDRIGFHVNAGAASDDPAVLVPRAMQSVTGACIAVRREWFREVRFDTEYRNGCEDLELCFRAIDAGMSVWYEPSCVVIHHESQSAGRFDHASHNLRLFLTRWASKIVPDTETFADAPKVARAVQRREHGGRTWSGSRAVYEFARGDSGCVDVVSISDAASCNTAIATSRGEWVVIAGDNCTDALRRQIIDARSSIDSLTHEHPEIAVASSDSGCLVALGITRSALDLVGGVSPGVRSVESQLSDLAFRTRLYGYVPFVVGHSVALRAVRSSRELQLFEPLGGQGRSAGYTDFSTRGTSVLVACNDAQWRGYTAALQRLLDQFGSTDDVTVIVRAVDMGSACAVLEQAATGISDADLVDIVLVEGDRSLDATLCEVADFVVVDSVPTLDLHGCARNNAARCITVEQLSAISANLADGRSPMLT